MISLEKTADEKMASEIYGAMSPEQRVAVYQHKNAYEFCQHIEDVPTRQKVAVCLGFLCSMGFPHTVEQAYGLRCPACGRDEEVTVHVLMACRLFPDGSEIIQGDHEWTDDSPALCNNEECNFTGTVRDFDVKQQKKER